MLILFSIQMSKLFLRCCTDGQCEPITRSVRKDSLDLREGNHVDSATTKNLYILLCSEKALYIYSFEHALLVWCSLFLSL